jgi:hypothetical protein
VLENAPTYDLDELVANDGMNARTEAYDYYKVESDWS